VEADEHGVPLRLCSLSEASLSEKHENTKRNRPWQEVTLLRRPWRIDQHWWRPSGEGAISRMYFRVAPEGGPPLTIYHDLIGGQWFRQEY
jgi:hypothetical protein